MVEFSAPHLIDAIIAQGFVAERELAQLLGSEQRAIPLPLLETRLVDAGVVSDQRLGLVKGALTGYPVLEDQTGVRSLLPESVARATGALVLDLPEAAVAFVEPNAANLALVREALRNTEFTIWVLTTKRFQELLREAYKHERTVRHPALTSFTEALAECAARRATDLHLSVGQPPMLRVNGTLTVAPFAPLDRTWFESQLSDFLEPAQLAELRAVHTLDFAYSYGQHRFRINMGRDAHGPTISARLLANQIPTMEELALPAVVRNFTELERGLVLVTGPTGSGKSTTLAALLEHIAQHRSAHLISLEDPIEYQLSAGPASVVKQRELGRDFTSFPAALRQALRQDPDVILVGEMRDFETAKTAIEAAETGHLVFSTLHTTNAMSTITRLVSMFPGGEQDHARETLANVLMGVVSQTLLPRATATGRVAAMEIMIATPAVTNNLRNPSGMSHLRSTLQTSRKDGMQTMEMALASLVLRGLVRQDEAEWKAREKDEFRRYLEHPEHT